jgi:hypothetical protein
MTVRGPGALPGSAHTEHSAGRPVQAQAPKPLDRLVRLLQRQNLGHSVWQLKHDRARHGLCLGSPGRRTVNEPLMTARSRKVVFAPLPKLGSRRRAGRPLLARADPAVPRVHTQLDAPLERGRLLVTAGERARTAPYCPSAPTRNSLRSRAVPGSVACNRSGLEPPTLGENPPQRPPLDRRAHIQRRGAGGAPGVPASRRLLHGVTKSPENVARTSNLWAAMVVAKTLSSHRSLHNGGGEEGSGRETGSDAEAIKAAGARGR